MKTTAAERKRKSREKLKENEEKWKEHLKKERERDASRRMKIKEDLEKDARQKAIWTEKQKIRKRILREKKKKESTQDLISISSSLGSYKTMRTLLKAVTKTKRALPESPTKKQAVIIQLTKDIVSKTAISSLETPTKTRGCVITEESRKKAQLFFERDDISRAAPGRKDTISVKDPNTGKRNHVAKRHMVMSVTEAYALFKESYPDIKLGKSTFFQQRPVHVKPMNEMPHNVCVCMYHANYSYLIEATHKIFPSFPSKTAELMQEMCCDVCKEECMTGKCKNCFEINDLLPQSYDENLKISWKQWMKTENGMQPSTISGTVQELLKELNDQTPKFKIHTFVKKQQSDSFEKCKQETSENEIVLQVDFAENFAILAQDEIQSAHWSHPQVTIFTGCAWAKNGNDKTSYLLLSNELSHDKYAVWTFLKKIIDDLKTDYPNLNKIYIFSDGCAAQFKNRFTLSSLCWSQEDWGVDVEWNFFATSHGKGAMDGVGATAKKLLWTAIMTRRHVINNSWECFDYLQSKQIKGTKIMFIACDDIEVNKERLDDRWQSVQAIPYVQKQHYFKALSGKSIAYALTAKSSQRKALLVQEGKLEYSDVYSDDSTRSVDQPIAKSKSSQFMGLNRPTVDAQNVDIVAGIAELSEPISEAHQSTSKSNGALSSYIAELSEPISDAPQSTSETNGELSEAISDAHQSASKSNASVDMNVDKTEPSPGPSGIRKTDSPRASNPEPEKTVKPGVYLLVEIKGAVGKKSKNYRYLAVSQGNIDDEDEVQVIFLKSMANTRTTFRIDEEDISYINAAQILKIIQDPIILTSGDRIHYKFNERIDVNEKK